ncbi:MAG: hypothetical protein KGL71_09785, partial [Xanthomonadaceae bacterium]|nr:hypothetical protein [Xanthomonadaceae bacterium]
MKLSCRCGQVQGEFNPARSYTRATCYCADCRAFARWLGGDGLLDAAGGSDIVAMAPDGLRFTQGLDQLACMSLGPRGLLRWYARCCRTPLGNVPRNPKLYYLGLPVAAIAESEAAVTANCGAQGHTIISPESATAAVNPTRGALLAGTLRIVTKLASARLRGRRNALLFAADGQPIHA